MKQQVLQDPDIERQRRAIDFDVLVAEMKELLAENPNPWLAVSEFKGENWLIASFGEKADGDRYRKWYVTTDHVCASEHCGDAEIDAKFCALAKRIMPELIERLEGKL